QDTGGTGEAAAEASAEGEGGGGGEFVISAANVQFDKQELTFPADQETTLTLNNEDSVEHNLSIYENEDAQQDLFIGPNVGPGASVDYDIPAMPEGEYFFRCDLHPTSMVGTVFVEAGGGGGEGGGEGNEGGGEEGGGGEGG
ncbi:MAG: cupredoxin domain-containing protein, partial [Actinomycetota bacterium]|nr:cupredoxin domain-containing protein [Actinomycetota bacterium]